MRIRGTNHTSLQTSTRKTSARKKFRRVTNTPLVLPDNSCYRPRPSRIQPAPRPVTASPLPKGAKPLPVDTTKLQYLATYPPIKTIIQEAPKQVINILSIADGFMPTVEVINQSLNYLINTKAIKYSQIFIKNLLANPDSVNFNQYDIVIMIRLCSNAISEEVIPRIRKTRAKIMYVLDDDLSTVDPTTIVGNFYLNMNPKDNIQKICQEADVVITLSKHLCNKLKIFNENTHFIAGSINLALITTTVKQDNTIKIVYTASEDTHTKDFQIVIPALKAILKEFPNVIFECFFSRKPEDFLDYSNFICKEFIDDFKSFYQVLNQSSWDIGIAPLVKSTFNESKSNVKYREYAAFKIAGVYSKSEAYDCIKNNETGIMCQTESEWYNAIKELIVNVEKRNTIIKNSYEDIKKNYNIEKTAHNYLNIFNKELETKRYKRKTYKLKKSFKKEVLIVSIIYSEFDIIKKHVDFLVKTNNNKSDIILLENKSKESFKIKNYCLDLVNQNKIFKYLQFDENIGMNVFETLFLNNEIDVYDYQYILITDGDLTSTSNNWLNESISILQNYGDNALCCGVSLDLSNLPVSSYPEAIHWYPRPSFSGAYYDEGITGLHLLLYRSEDFDLFIDYAHDSHSMYMDVAMHTFCSKIIKKKWLRTKTSKAYHHTWDLYLNKKHPYSILKRKPHTELWIPEKFCNYFVYSFNNEKKSINIEKRKGLQHTSIEASPIVNPIINISQNIPTPSKKLNIGCGNIIFNDWVNIDIDSSKANIKHDIRKGIPVSNNSIDFIFNEHFIEHLTLEEAQKFLKECYRVLANNGILRISTFDVDNLIRAHSPDNPNWKEDAHLISLKMEWVQTRAESLNIAFRWWGHQYVYNYDELVRRLKEAGFKNIKRCEINKSDHSELINKETRKESDLIIEAQKI